MRLYKLTDENDLTLNTTIWGEGFLHRAEGGGPLCTDAWIHAYTDPLLAVLMAPIYGYSRPECHLWEADGEVGIDDGLKVGCYSLLTIRRIEQPRVTMDDRIRFAIMCALEVCQEDVFTTWAEDWLSGKDRSPMTAYKQTQFLEDAAWVSASAVAWLGVADEVSISRTAEAATVAARIMPMDFVMIAHRALNN